MTSVKLLKTSLITVLNNNGCYSAYCSPNNSFTMGEQNWMISPFTTRYTDNLPVSNNEQKAAILDNPASNLDNRRVVTMDHMIHQLDVNTYIKLPMGTPIEVKWASTGHTCKGSLIHDVVVKIL